MCGFVSIIGVQPAAPALALGLQAIQHRGQDAAGIATRDNGRLRMVKDLGLITNALPTHVIEQLPGDAGIAHVRYPTAGAKSTAQDAQPFLTRRPGILLAHNGNVINVPELTQALREEGIHLLSSCDAEPILMVLTAALSRRRAANHTAEDVAAAVGEVYRRVRGGYSVVAILEVDGEPTMLAFRDPHGIRPGVYGQRADGAWVAASESVSLDVLGVEKAGDLPLGEAMLLRPGRAPVLLPVTESEPKHCVFERIYFARPDSVMEAGRINRDRWRMGRQLAQEWRAAGHTADVVVAVPDTSRPAAQACAEELGLRHREGFIKNRYSGRTFIMPDQATRNAALRLKLNPIREIFEGQRVLLIDDSIVRGNTMRRIVEMIRTLNPVEIHVGIFSPPVRHPCFYGIDMPSHDELIAAHWPEDEAEEELRRYLGVDSVTYISKAGLADSCGPNICSACFTGDYIVPVSEEERRAINSERRG
ncbi:MAG: amidophosphoribosyltransferase [Myxococcota bacterium]|nr:amidophosphoribosyltransferase [Myxococcota bacterium]